MTRDAITIGPRSDHAEAARLMREAGVKRLPVVDHGALVGVVSRSDIMRVFARPDREIIDEIRDRVMRQILWIEPNQVEIRCDDGNIVLSGQLPTRVDAQLLAEFARRVDGVASVRDELSWKVDNTKVEMVPPVPVPRW